MDIEERTQVMDSISRAGDAMVLKFAAHCMRLMETQGEVTADDARDFAASRSLL